MDKQGDNDGTWGKRYHSRDKLEDDAERRGAASELWMGEP